MHREAAFILAGPAWRHADNVVHTTVGQRKAACPTDRINRQCEADWQSRLHASFTIDMCPTHRGLAGGQFAARTSWWTRWSRCCTPGNRRVMKPQSSTRPGVATLRHRALYGQQVRKLRKRSGRDDQTLCEYSVDPPPHATETTESVEPPLWNGCVVQQVITCADRACSKNRSKARPLQTSLARLRSELFFS